MTNPHDDPILDFSGGWVKFPRRFTESRVWKMGSDYAMLYLYLYLEARHGQEPSYSKSPHGPIEVKTAQLYRTQRGIAVAIGLNANQKNKVGRMLNRLSNIGFITENRTKDGTIITVNDYSKMQGKNSDENIGSGPRTDHGRTTDGPRTDHGRTNKKKDKKEKKGKKEEKEETIDLSFARFWEVWPKKVARPAAEKAWAKLKPPESLISKIVANVTARAHSEDWTKNRRKYCPYPATYLNGRRWEDETNDILSISEQYPEPEGPTL